MDTRDHALTKLTWLHDESHPTPSPTSEPMKELLTPGGEHHGIGDEEGLVMTKIKDPPLRSPKRTPDLASRWRTGGGGGSVSWNAIILFPWFFSLKMWFYSFGIRVSGATGWGQPTWACQEGVAHPGGLCSSRGPPRWFLALVFFI
jgi:hypothetical protein